MTAVRTCTGCGRKAEQGELIRFGARDGRLVAGRREPGRGAYTCKRLACFELAASRRAFNRVLRQTVQVEPALTSLYDRPDPVVDQAAGLASGAYTGF